MLRDADVSWRLADVYEAPEILFDLAEEQRGDYRTMLNGLIPIQIADEMSALLGYAGDVPIPTVDGPPDLLLARAARLIQDVRDNRTELLVELRKEAAYGVGIGYALARYRLDLEETLALLEPCRPDDGVPACARLELPDGR